MDAQRQRQRAPAPLVGEGWGEGLRPDDRSQPLTRIASSDAIRPLPQGKASRRRFDQKEACSKLVANEIIPAAKNDERLFAEREVRDLHHPEPAMGLQR